MKAPGIGIDIHEVTELDHDGNEFSTGTTNVEISGNRDGLLQLADAIRSIADSGDVGLHVHFMHDDEAPLLRTENMWLTVTLNSKK